MNRPIDLFLLLALAVIGALWLSLSRARERALAEARRQCRRHGLQLLDETIGLRGLRLRRLDGRLTLERCYGFEVSLNGDDRQAGRLWMVGERTSGLSLPTLDDKVLPAPSEEQRPAAAAPAPLPSNVIPLRRPPRDRLH
ncbi:DUF3301 domain-containing protein [Frateuria defendens]|uniref:DUF3301 domain-containing protein n=1 Tax=Frateuria defendens TaxID=2219559 RepID=UPI00066FD867|nr:DUF3301 domain-containing protein [Frateuria defendens]